MRTEPLGTEVIERYLRNCGLRYFRGRHDAEYFFLLPLAHDRLHVHVEISPADPDVVSIRVTPGYYFPAVDRARLLTLAHAWNRDNQWAKVHVEESADPMRIGLVAEHGWPITNALTIDDFAAFADQAIHSAVHFFRELSAQIAVPDTRETFLRHAG